MADFGPDSNGARWCWFRNLAASSGIRHSRLSLDSRFCMACTAIRGVVYGSAQGSVRCHPSFDIERATFAPVGDMSGCRCGLRGGNLFVEDVAGAVASGSCFHSLRFPSVGSGNH